MTHARLNLAWLILWGALSWAAPATAEPISHWNDIAVRAVSAGRPGAPGFLDLALVHAAMHDAVQAHERRFEPYLSRVRHASGAAEAAAAAAAHGVLVGIYPSQRAALDADLAAFLEAHGLVGDAGLETGERVAAEMLTAYRPAPALPAYTGGMAIGQWRPTPSYQGNPPAPPPFSPMAALYLSFTRPYTLRHAAQFRVPPPPPVRSGRYRRDYDEVRAMGALTGSARTPDQTDMAYFWNDNVVTQWSRVLRQVSESSLATTGDRARLFALAYLATSDALISAWESKYHYSYWRPVTAIQEGDADGNPRTNGDPEWQPLANTPNYPDYPSGANGVSGAMTATLRGVLGTNHLSFTISSAAPNVTERTRTYQKLSEAADEVVEARMYLGFHFRFADEVARDQGERVAGWVLRKYLRPRHGKR